MKSNSNVRPAIIQDLGNGSFHYNYNVTERKIEDEEVGEKTVYDYDTVQVWEKPTYENLSTKQVAAVMQVEVDTLNRTSGFLVLQHTFSSVTKRKDTDAGSTDRSLSGNLVHFCIA